MKVFNAAALALMCQLCIAGCSTSAHEGVNTQGQSAPEEAAGSQQTAASVIVVFKEGTTYDEAVRAAADHGMKVTHYYKTLSERSNKPYMVLESTSLSEEEMLLQLKNDPRVETVSVNYQRKLLDQR